MPSRPLATRLPRLGRNHVLALLLTCCALVAGLLVSQPAHAAGANPTGSLDSVTLTSDGVVAVSGWTADTDAPTTALRVYLMDNGNALTTMIANQSRTDVAAAYPAFGAAHGFRFRLIDSDGSHTYCVTVVNAGGGGTISLGCNTVLVHNNPTGSMGAPTVNANTVTFSGTATDSNSGSPVLVRGYLDGRHVTDSLANGSGHAYTIALTVPEGSHQLCLYALNIGAGANTTLGCQTVVIRNNPIGRLESAGQVPAGLQATGYALDLNNVGSAVSVWAYLDGKYLARTDATLSRPDVANHFPGAGASHGFNLVVPAGSGRHQLCLNAINIGPGANTSLGCSTVTIANNPIGMLDSAVQLPYGVQLQGWAIDLNSSAALTVKFTVDGRAAGSTTAGIARPDLAKPYPYSGIGHGYSMLLAIGAGKHTVCAVATNVGAGVNSGLGCRSVTVQNNPIGTMESARQVPGGLQLSGWALDLNSTGPISVYVYSDGRLISRASAANPRADLAAAFPTVGGGHGYSLIAPVGPGRHAVCVVAINTGPGANSQLRCQTLTLTDLPLGRLESQQVVPGGVQLTGWAMDGFISGPIDVRVYVDGKIAAISTAAGRRSDLQAHYPNMGPGHGFSVFSPVPAGSHTVCAYAINPRHATNLTLSCRATTRIVNPTGASAGIARVGLTNDITLSGWALDPDQLGSIQLHVLSDGVDKQTITANRGNLASTTGWPMYGYTHGYSSTVTLDSGEHRVCVVARNTGQGSDTTIGCTLITTSGEGAPAMPTSVTAWAGSKSVTLGWVAPRSDNAAITKYLVTIVQRGTVITVAGNATGAVVGSLTNGAHYTFTIRAVNSLGTGSAALTGAIPTNIPPQVTPAPVSTSHYLRNLTGNLSSDAAVMRAMGASDASHDPSGHSYLVLLQIGGQDEINHGALLSATSRFVSYPAVVSAVKAYLDGYASQQRPYAPLTLAVGTNNDVDVSAGAGISWARNVVAPVVSYAAAHHPGMIIAGANDMEPGFSATVSQTRSWLAGYLSATGAQFVFNGSADGCSTSTAGSGCNNGWRMADLQWLSGGAAPSRIISLPQIYNYAMPQQWKYISLTGTSSGLPRIYFGGPLTEQTACVQAGSCGSISNVVAWSQLWSAISSSAATRQFQMPHGTDLRIN